MNSKQYISKLSSLCLSTALIFSLSAAYADEEHTLSEYKTFSEVFSETINTEISDIKYGIICYPSEGINRAAELESEDLTALMNAYNSVSGMRILAPQSMYFDALTYTPKAEYPYFYIGISAALPTEHWTWHKTVKMSQLCFGGSYNGATIYGGYGIAESSYGAEYPNALPTNFVWYKPTGSATADVVKTANKIYNKYKTKAKPFGDYESTKDDQYFSGYDGTFSTLFHLPVCFTSDGCSEWAYKSLQRAAQMGVIPYDTSHNYTLPLTRREFCELTANMLNMVPYRNYNDIFKNPNSYTVLSEKAVELGVSAETVKYSDINISDDSIRLLSALGIVNGIDEDSFNPNGYITREQVCAILGRIFNVYPEFTEHYSSPDIFGRRNEASTYSDDSDISAWARDYVYAMTKYGLMSGTGDNAFLPREYCTLEQAIIIILRTSDLCIIKEDY